MDVHPRQLLFMCECVTEELCKMVMANAGVKNTVWGNSKLQLCVCVCVTEMLASKERLHQDLRGIQMCALEEECKKANRIALDNYNRALVQ